MVRYVKVRDAMSTEVHEIPEDATLQSAGERMATAHVNSLLVRLGGREEPFGILTSSDLVDAVADRLDPTTTLVRDVATAPLVTVTPGVPIVYDARLMKRANLRHLVVFNGRVIVGILSGFDIAKAMGQHGRLTQPDEDPIEAEAMSLR